MPRSTDWTRNETLAAFHIYLQMPFGQLNGKRFKYIASNSESNITNG
jgi:DNA (cytosine-5)-methyltransferase 1/putative restriction endonuclease